MNASLPDTARHLMPSHSHSLDWVGMENIRIPLSLKATDVSEEISHVSATVDIGIDLPGGEGARKGIHMSRLYRALLTMSEQPLTLPAVLKCLQECVSSHEDCYSYQAKITIAFDLLLLRPALLTQAAAGWQGYAVELSASTDADGNSSVSVGVDVAYSSTCPCSAALSRQALSEHFRIASEADPELAQPDPLTVSQWLLEHGSVATPHSQRSVARINVSLSPDAVSFGIGELIHQIESALQTPVQTFVKRADEQAFALRNGSNLMYVEDASRRILDALSGYQMANIQVRHYESLHGHDAVAKSNWIAPAMANNNAVGGNTV